MADEPNNQAESTNAPAETSSADAESKQEGSAAEDRRFSQAEVDLMVTKAKEKATRSAERRVRQELEAKKDSSPAEKPPQSQPTASNGSDALSEIRAELEQVKAQAAQDRKARLFAEAVAGRSLSKEATETLRKHFNPDDMDGFEDLLELAAAAGPKPAAATAPTPGSSSPTNGTPPANPAAPSVAQPQFRSHGSASGHQEGDLDWDLRRANRDQLQRYQEDGSLRDRVNRFRARLPGGTGGYFSPKGGVRKV